ncbi:MAG TPA: hypothetical protein VG099_20345 [Gemmataceae bacterium]|nr:hypothetical protein [Gemmataceae bacterium]
MVRKWLGLVLLVLWAGRAPGQGMTYKLTIGPAALPSPVLKYHLLPDSFDVTPGNAAMLYYRAFSPEWEGWRRQPGLQDKISEALQASPQALPRAELDWVLNSKQLQELDLAARREYCDWGFTTRVKQEGIGMLLPEIQRFRAFANVLALRTRFELADKDFGKAAYSLQTGFALGKDVANAPLLINALVGVAIASVQAGQVDQWIQTPGSPNLYWSLTELPRPFIAPSRPLSGERLWLYAEVPLARDLEKKPLSPQQTQDLVDSLVRLMHLEDRSGDAEARLALMALALKFYPQARKELIAEGRKAEDVDAMPIFQVYVIHALRRYFDLQDDLFKWYTLPYAQAFPGLERADQDIRRARQRLEAIPFVDLLPAIVKVYTAYARLDRRFAAQRCIEAIRLYAASHDGKLPAALSEITEVPVPEDPMLGKPFAYHASGNHATLRAAVPVSANELTYELTLKP